MGATSLLTTAAAREAAILRAVRAVKRGEIAAYGEIARRAGLPRRARLVGQVLRKTKDPTLPWHRITGYGGRIALPVGSRARREQVKRLQREGVQFRGGRALARGNSRHTERNLDALLWRLD
jgi:methylated-DNA-protein-cysteine methyltransferase-like protein